MSDSGDAVLIRQVLDGDTRRFEALVDEYQKPVFNTVLRIVGDYDDATDVAQATFIKAYRNLGRYDAKHRFFSWLYKIAVNEALNFVKSRRHGGTTDGEVRSDERQPDERMLDDERDRQVQDALMRLTEDQRSVIVLYHFQDLSYDEIGSVLGIPVTRVKSRLFEARTKLKHILVPVNA